MQVGSKVEFVANLSLAGLMQAALLGAKIPEKGKPYTIKEMWKCDKCKTEHILVEELVIGYLPDGNEIPTNIDMWRELQPPQQNVDEIINKVLCKAPEEKKVKELEPEMA